MADSKITNNIEAGSPDYGVNELVRIVHSHLVNTSSMSSPVSSPTNSTRTYTPPLMGTSARAAKRRMDSDSGPIRIEGTDTYNQQLQHHYQNVRHILEGQEQQQQKESNFTNPDPALESKQSFSAKRDFFEQRFKTPPPTYDCPPRQQQQAQKIVTTITTTTTTAPAPATTASSVPDRTSSSSNESPSVDRVLEQAVELQKMSSIQAIKTESPAPLVLERTEEYQVFLDSSNHEVRRTPSISRTSIVQLAKTGHATDLDQAQAEVERLTDDHQAIQQLTRVLQEHNVSTLNEYKRLPSQTGHNLTASSTLPSDVLSDRTNLPIDNEFSVIDALVNNPIGTYNENHNNLLNKRCNDIMTNLRNPEYLSVLKQSIITNKKSKKKPKEKEPKEKKSKEKKPKEKKTKEKKSKERESEKNLLITDDTIERATVRSHINSSKTATQPTTQPVTTAEPTATSVLSEQVPLIDPKEKRKQDKENKKISKKKSKETSKAEDYHVVDAIIGSPVSLRLPESYLNKYNVSPPLSLSSPLQSLPPPVSSNTTVPITGTTSTTTTTKDTNTDKKDKNQTLFHLVNIVRAIQSHHIPAFENALNTPPSKPETTIGAKQSAPIVNQQILLEQQRPIISANRPETSLQSEPVRPRVVYRYMDEQGRVLKISSVPPSELREEPVQQYIYHATETPYLYGRHIAIDDERRHPLPQYEQHATWQGEPKLPTTLTREDFESRDKRVPHLTDPLSPPGRTVPMSVDNEYLTRTSSRQQPRTYHYPNQQTVKLAWLPLSYPADQAIPGGAIAGYDTDSTISERSGTQRPYEYVPTDSYYRHANRPYYNEYYYNRSPGPIYQGNPPMPHYSGRGISPEYGGMSRNYIEVFRGGDFRETKPSEIYSLPLTDQIRTSPNFPPTGHHSRYDQYQSEKYGTMLNQNNIPSSQPQKFHYSNSLPKSRYQQKIPSATVQGSSYYTHCSPHHHHTVQSSPNPECTSSIRQSKSFDYRPLRTKLQREYKITPNLLVDEWEYPQTTENTKYSTATSATHPSSGVSSPDEVFIKKPNELSNESYEYHEEGLLELNRAKLRPQTNDSQPIYKALALYNFYAETDRELSFKKGDTLVVKRRINDDWLEGERQGSTGIFPLNYVELFPYEINEEKINDENEQQIEGEAIAKYDFIPEKTYELQLKQGNKVTLLRKLDNNWYEGRVNHSEGTFPAEYVETLREPKEKLLQQSYITDNTTKPTKMPKSVLKNPIRSSPTATEKTTTTPDLSLPLQKCQVLYDYTPQNSDELELHVGDIISIIEMCDDGWYCGIMEKSNYGKIMEFGTFPGNYVKMLPADA